MARSKFLQVRLNDEELEALDYICESGISKSDAVRLMILCTSKGLFYIEPDRQDEFNALFDKYVGRNK